MQAAQALETCRKPTQAQEGFKLIHNASVPHVAFDQSTAVPFTQQ
jgi:hypothetical protein